MRLYRLAKTHRANDLSGEGAKRAGGRWNPPGTPVLYMAESGALAILEVLQYAHVQDMRNFSMLVLEAPDDASIQQIELQTLPCRRVGAVFLILLQPRNSGGVGWKRAANCCCGFLRRFMRKRAITCSTPGIPSFRRSAYLKSSRSCSVNGSFGELATDEAELVSRHPSHARCPARARNAEELGINYLLET